MRVADIMTAPVLSVMMDDRLPAIRDLMEAKKIHHLPVLEGKKLVGIISDRDILRILSPFIGTAGEMQRDTNVLNKAAHQIMTRQPITVRPTDDIDVVLNWLKKLDISCVLVTDDEANLLGIITWRDLIMHAKYDH